MSDITKKALGASLKNLLRVKPLNKITIQDLTSECGISRSAFYYHFQDIYGLVDWVCRDDFSRALAGNRTADTWEEGFKDIFHEIERDRDFIYNVYRYTDHDLIGQYLNKRTFQLVMGVVEEQAREISVSEEEKRLIADFYKYGLVGLVIQWIEGGMKEDSDVLVDRLSLIIRGNIAAGLRACAEARKI